MNQDTVINDLKASEQLWKEILSKYTDHKTRAEKLLEKGVREVGKGQISFDIVLSCEALGEAELAGVFYEESVVFGKYYKAFKFLGFPPMKEGRFILTNSGHLFPTFRESMRVYRGQTRYIGKCQPLLWRKDMDDNKRLIQYPRNRPCFE